MKAPFGYPQWFTKDADMTPINVEPVITGSTFCPICRETVRRITRCMGPCRRFVHVACMDNGLCLNCAEDAHGPAAAQEETEVPAPQT